MIYGLGINYKTMGDIVMEHVEECPRGTDAAKRLLELPSGDEFNSAANLYLAALSIIREKTQGE